jgi:hypothetical protein
MIFLGFVAVIVVIAVLLTARSRHRRGLRLLRHESLPDSAGTWEAEHRGYVEGQEFKGRDIGGPTW